MEPPFTGMDPYLGRSSMWPNVHHQIITAICDQIQLQIVPHDITQIIPYRALEQIDIASPRRAVSDGMLVTAIEILSPVNKRPGIRPRQMALWLPQINAIGLRYAP